MKMKHSFKRLLSMVLALAMVLSCVPVQAFAEECAHEYDIVITGPSCTEPGSMVYTCGLCGDTYEEEGEEPSGHDYAVDEVPATCLEDGLVSYVCTVCGESETEEIGAPGHCYVDGACEACGEPDPEAEEPSVETTEAPAEEELVVETVAPVDADDVASEVVGSEEDNDEGDGGEIEPDMPEDMTQAKFLNQLAASEAKGENYYLTSNLTLTEDLTIDADVFVYFTKGTLTVPADKTLKVNNRIVLQGGTIVVEAGGALSSNNNVENWCHYEVQSGSIEVKSGATVDLAKGGIIQYFNNNVNVSGINMSLIKCFYFARNTDAVADAIGEAGNFGLMEIFASTTTGLILEESLTIPDNVVLNIQESTVTIPEEICLTNNGKILIFINGDMVVDNGGTLENGKEIEVREGCTLTVNEGGTFINNGTITGEGSYPGSDGGSDEPVGDAVARLGEDGKTFTTLEAAIEAAAAIDIDNRPFVSLLKDCTVSETIVIDEAINIFYIGGDGKNPTVTAAEGVDTLFEITENGELLLNDIDMVTPGDYIINITGDNAAFMAVNCNLNGGGEAAINVADDVNWYYPPTDQGIPTTIQVYNSTVGGRTALHLGGSNTTATFAPGNESGAVELMGDNPDGVIVIDGDGHDVKMYGVSIETSAGNNNAFTMNGDSVIEIAGGSFNGDSVDDRFNGWGEPLPQSGAVARANAQYFGSLQSALDAAAEYEFEEGEVPLTILEELTIDNTVTLPETKTDIRMLGENITLTETGAIDVYGKMSLELDGDNRIWMGLGTVHVFEGGDLWNGWQVVGTVTESTESYLSAYWVHEQGEGWFENLYEHHPNLDMRMAPGEDHCLSFYKNVWDPDNGRWNRTSVGADQMDLSDGLKAIPMTEQDWVDGNFKEGEANYENFVQLYVKNDAPWDEQQTITVGDVPYTVYVEIDPDQGFYAGPEATNENWLIKYRYNKFREENSFYFIFTREGYTLQRAYLKDESSATIESTEDPNIWKITMKPEAMELTEDGYYRDFEIRVFMEVKENGYDHIHNWDYGIWYEPWIWNVQAGDDISHVDMMFAIDSFHNVDYGYLGWTMDGNLTLDPNVNDGELDIDMGWRDDEQRFFRLSDECGKGVLTVRSGTKLIVNSPLEIYGGKIIIEDGGEMVINQPVVVSGGEINGVTYGNGSIEIQPGGKLTMVDENELFINGGSVTVNGTMELGGDSMTTIQGKMTLGADAVLSVRDNAKIEVGSRGTLTVANSENVSLAEADSIRVFLPNDKVSGIDGLWGTWLVEEASQMQTAVNDFAENGKYANYGIKEIAPYHSMTLTDHITIADDVRLLLYPWEGPVLLDVPLGLTLTNFGEIYAGRDCHIVGDGGFINNGTIIEEGDSFEGITLDDLQSVINEAYGRDVWLTEDAVLAGDLWIPEELEVFTENVTITVPENETLNLNGGLTLNGTTLNVLGTLNVNGPLFVNNGSYVYVDNGAALNVNHAIHVGYYKDGDVGGYAGVVDICGTMNACGYVNIVESGENSGGVLNVYGDMHLVPDPETENRYGLLEIGGEFCLGGSGILDLSSEIPVGNGGISVNWNGSLKQELKDDNTPGTINVPTEGTVSVDAGALDRIDGIDPSCMIVNYNIGGNAEDLEYALTEAGENVDVFHEVNVATWDTTIELDREITVPADVTLYLNNNGDGYYEELIIPEGFKLINNGTIVLNAETCLRNFGELENNGTIILEQWSSMMNYGIITGTEGKDGILYNGSEYAEGNTSQSDLEDALATMSPDAGGWIHESVTRLEENMTIDLGIRESDGAERAFRVAKYGQIIVPNGVTLTLNSPTMLNGGQIIVEDGGTLVVNRQLHIGSGTLYLKDGATLVDEDQMITGNRTTRQSDDLSDYFTAYNVNSDNGYAYDTIDEWGHGPDYEREIIPGYGRYLVFYINHWNDTDKIWERTPIHPSELKVTKGLWINRLIEDEGYNIMPGYRNGDCYVAVGVHYDENLWDTTQYVSYRNWKFPIYVRRDQMMGFYSSAVASNGTYLDEVPFGPNCNNLIYFIVTDENIPANGLSVTAELEAGPETIENGVQAFKYSNKTWVLMLSDEATSYLNRNYWLRVNVQWDGGGTSAGINCFPWTWMVEKDAYFEINGEGYEYYAPFDTYLRWNEQEWNHEEVTLPEGVSYDLESNTLTLNGANLNYLGVGYHWSNGNEEGYNLPNPDLTIEVLGENEIGGGQAAFDIRGDANVTIVGDGSLSIWNNNDNGTMWSQNAVNVEDSILTIGGSVDITMAVSGENWWDFGNGLEPCTMHAIQGGETSNLIITDSATVNIHVPDLRGNEADEDGGFEYRGLANFANITVEKRATVNLDTLHLKDGQTFIQNGGTVNIDDPGTIIYMDDQGNTRKVYEPVVIREGSRMLITGGTMNLTLDDTDTNARGAIIKVENDSELQISGGQITINNNVKAPGIYVSGDSRLFFTGGTMYYNGTMFEDGERTAFINVDGQANFTGGTIRVENGVFNFYGWNENAPMIQWMGTNLIAKNTVIEQNGSFRMTGGKMQLTNSRFHSNNNTVFAGGTMDMDNSVLIVNGYTGVEGVALLDFDVTDAFYTDTSFEGTTFQDNCAIEVNNYFPVAGFAKINIDAALDEYSGSPFSGIRISAYKNDKGEVIVGGYHQMGGTVTINSNGAIPTIDSWGNIMLNAGTLNLTGTGGIHIAFAEDIFKEAYGEVNEADKNFFDMHEGFGLNVDATAMGLELRTNSGIQGGNLNVKATGEGGVGVYVSNGAELYISGGNHNITANHNGIMIDNGSLIVEKEPEIHVEAGHAALYSRMEKVDEIHIEFAEDSIFDKNASATANLWVKEDRSDDPSGYRYALSSDGENFAKSIRFNKAPMTLQKALAAMGDNDYVVDDDKNHRYQLTQAVIVEESMELDRVLDVLNGGKITVRNGATLTIPDGSAHLIAKKNGAVIVEAGGKIVNGGIMAADGGVIIVNSNGYEHMDGAILNSHFHETPNEEGGYRLDLDSVRGIPEIYVNLDGTVDTTEGLQNVLAAAQNGYKEVRIWTANDMDLSDLYIPANTSLSIDGQEVRANVTVDEGTELYIDGQLNLGNVNFTVNGELHNYGYVQTDLHDAAVIDVNGIFVNHKEMNLNKATLNVNGALENDGFIAVNEGSVINVFGELNDNGQLWVGFFKQTPEEAANNDCEYVEGPAGTVEVTGKLTVNEQMDIYGDGVVNVLPNGILENNNMLNIYGALTVSSNGTLDNQNAIELFGAMRVAGTLINDFEICMWDTENQSGASLILDEGGTFYNHLSLYNGSYGGVVDVTNGTFINEKANADDPYDPEILAGYFGDGNAATMTGIPNGMIILSYEGDNTAFADEMTAYGEKHGYAYSLFRVKGAAYVAPDQEVTVDWLVMLPGSQLGVNGVLNNKNHLRMRAGAEMTISSTGRVKVDGGMIVHPADENIGLEAAVVNNKGILECGAQGVLDILGEYNDSGKVYINMAPTEYNDGYNVGGFTEDCVISEADAILVMDVYNNWEVGDLVAWVNELGYSGGLIHINAPITIMGGLWIPENVTVEISENGSLCMNGGQLTNNSTITVNDNDCALTVKNGASFVGTGTYTGGCGENMTWTVKNGILTISGSGDMGDSYEEPLPWADFDDAVTKIVLGSDVTNIGGGAFRTFNATITIPSTVTEIGISALGTCTLKIYHDSYAETYVKDPANGIDESKILYFHVIDPESGECTYTECGYSIYTVLDSTAKPEEKIEEIKSIDAETLKGAMEKAESDPENDLVDQLDQLEQEVKNVTGLDVGIKHSEDVSEEIADAFSNVSEDAAIIGAVLNAEEGVEEVNLVIGDPETTLDEEETRDYNMDASVHFSMTMEGVGNASQLDVPVKITLPIPDSIFDLAKLVVKHFHAGGEDDLTNSCVVTVDEDGKAYVSFFVTGFSDFLLAQRATPITLTARINHNTVTEGTNPDDIFISVTAREKATNKTVSGLSTNYIIRDAEGNEVELEEALAKAGTYTVEPHCLVLDAQYVIMEDADVVTATLTVEEVEKVEYVCVNTTTGEQYESLADALEAADDEISGVAGNETIKMMEDCSENYFIVPTGTTLDLNGRTLTAKAVSAVDGAHIVDSTRKGLLRVAKQNIYLDESNSMIPIWNTVDGYVFTNAVINDYGSSVGLKVDETSGVATFKFIPFFQDTVLLKDGVVDNNLSVEIVANWAPEKEEDGNPYKYFVYGDVQIGQVVTANGKASLMLTVGGYKNFKDLTFTAKIISGTGVEFSGSVHKVN